MPVPSILFVCLGNICRSPLAEAAFRAEAARTGLAVTADSAGTGGWHAGQAPDARAQAIALTHGSDISTYRARQVKRDDFTRFSHIFALDHSNLANLKALRPREASASLALLLDVVPGMAGQAVADPYYGDARDFAACWDQVNMAAQALMRHFAG